MAAIEAVSIPNRIARAFHTASRATGASFEFLLNTAVSESGLNDAAKAKTSSAKGMFQFIESTWLETMKLDGARLGYSDYANSIRVDSKGRYRVDDPAVRQEILNLRGDTVAASKMAGAYAERNASILESRTGRKPTDGELYIAHFLGPGGGSKLINLAERSPGASAAASFKSAAAANRPIFYNKDGSARSVGEVYNLLVEKGAPSTPPPLESVLAGISLPQERPAQENPLFARSYPDSVSDRVRQAFSAVDRGTDERTFARLFTNLEPFPSDFDWKRENRADPNKAVPDVKSQEARNSENEPVGNPLNLLAFTDLFSTEAVGKRDRNE